MSAVDSEGSPAREVSPDARSVVLGGTSAATFIQEIDSAQGLDYSSVPAYAAALPAGTPCQCVRTTCCSVKHKF